MWGIIPAAGCGTRIQPLAFSKELLPVGSCIQENSERPRAISEYLIERMSVAGVDKICMVIAPGKSDILRYYGAGASTAHFCYVVQQHPRGLCDAIFSAHALIHPDEQVIVGLPDTIWFPHDGLKALPDHVLSLLLFPVDHPQFYDSVETAPDGKVLRINVKQTTVTTHWIWGAFKLSGHVLHDLFSLWCSRGKKDEYFGTLVNSYIDNGAMVIGSKTGRIYVDVGTVHGYREAVRLLSNGSLDYVNIQ